MLSSFKRFKFVGASCIHLNLLKRDAGHSKWANIRHVKAAKDHEKSKKITYFCKLMAVAVHENGGEFDPMLNPALQNVIDEAIKENVPKSVYANFLKKKKEGAKEDKVQIKIRGPKESIALITCLTDNRNVLIQTLRHKLKKSCFTFTDGFQNVFEDKGYILAKAPSSSISISDAEEIAILAEAEEVTESEEEQAFWFVTSPESLWKSTKFLKSSGWTVLQASNETVATNTVELLDSELEEVDKYLRILQELPECAKVVDNIARKSS